MRCAAAPVGIEDAYQTALEVLPAILAGAGYTTVGLPELRAALAERYATRGLATNPDQILIIRRGDRDRWRCGLWRGPGSAS